MGSDDEPNYKHIEAATGVSLHESIGKEGVQSPIRLSEDVGNAEGVRGTEGKRQLAGGHHRLASASAHEASGTWSHQFVPVLHYTDINEAKGPLKKAPGGRVVLTSKGDNAVHTKTPTTEAYPYT